MGRRGRAGLDESESPGCGLMPAGLGVSWFRRWTAGCDAHPHDALLGILSLLHGASRRPPPLTLWKP